MVAGSRIANERAGAFITGRLRWLCGIAILVTAPSVAAQTPSWARLPSLRFFGFRVGTPLETAARRVDDLSGTAIACGRSTVDQRVLDCRSTFPDPITSDPVELWLSALDSLVAVLTGSWSLGVLAVGWSAYHLIRATKAETLMSRPVSPELGLPHPKTGIDPDSGI